MANKLSHSSCSTYQACPRKWEYHYRHSLRNKFTSSALIMGNAVGLGVQAILEGRTDHEAVFLNAWSSNRINNVEVELMLNPTIVYSDKDFDLELLTDMDCESVLAQYNMKSREELADALDKLYAFKDMRGISNLPEDQLVFLNHVNWLCLKTKGLLMVNAFKTKILPSITKVHSIEEAIDFSNEEGDSIVGSADFVVDYKGYDKPVILDLKTSARPYESDSVVLSPQLSVYLVGLGEKYNTNYAGYVVLNKNVIKNRTKICKTCKNDGSGKRHKTCDVIVEKKRCDGEWDMTIDFDIITQVIIDKIPERTSSLVMENFNDINQLIKSEVFPRNLQSCKTGYGKCQFFDKCYKDSEEGLIRVNSSKKIVIDNP